MKILFATMPFDGHFNPLTSLAVHLRDRGHDVRWYTGPSYGPKLEALGVPHFPFQRAREVNAQNLAAVFPEYDRLGSGPKAIEFALTKIFFGDLEAHYEDVAALRVGFPFDALVCDAAFYAARLVASKLQPRVWVVSPAPTPAPTSKTAPPPFFGLRPAGSVLGRARDAVVRKMVEGSTKSGKRLLNEVLARHGLPPYEGSVFDLHVGSSRGIFQVGAPGMDFPREDWPEGFRFVGPLLPHKQPRAGGFPLEEQRARCDKLIVVSQGTVDNRDPGKLLVPALQALAGGPHLVVATTGRRSTDELRRRFPHDNVVVEDFVDFDVLLPRADLFVCNGGYGSIMQALVCGVPILSAGKLEGKSDINARLSYHGLGIDLRTERPTPKQIAAGAARVLGEPRFRDNVARVRDELLSYRPLEIIERAIVEDLEGAAPDGGRQARALSFGARPAAREARAS